MLQFTFYVLMGGLAAFCVTMLILTIRLRRARERVRARAARRAQRGYTCLLFIPRPQDKPHCVMCGETEEDHVDYNEWETARLGRPITDEERDETETGMWPR